MLNFVLTHKRWFVGGFVALVLSIMVWTIGPLIGSETDRPLAPWSVRLLIVLLIVALWLGLEALRVYLVQRRNRRMMEAMAAESPDAKLSREESATLQKRFGEAMSTLRRTELGGRGGRRLLYQLPWYLFIGEPGSGKTTALLHSGLRFPLSAAGGPASELRGVGGTRNCDWFFTEEAVLIDTAGRYVAQDSNAEVDRTAWHTFLSLLKKYRPRQPVNGVIATLSIQDLLGSGPDERATLASRIRARLEELQQALGLRCPVYLMVTKCDLIQGFSEFFVNLDAEQRAQVWGETFEFDLARHQAGPAKPSFDAAFPALVERLNKQLLERLVEERDLERRSILYGFPQQFAALGPLISEFLDVAFVDTQYARPVMLRGVYFTSGTQLGSPIDRVIAGLSSALDLRGGDAREVTFGGAGKSYFIARLLREVIFAEAGLAAHNEVRERQLRRLSVAAMALGALVAAGLVAAWTVSYFGNRTGLNAARAATADAAGKLATVGAHAANDLPVLLDALDALKAVPLAVHDPVEDPRSSLQWGLYQGESVAASIGERYRLALQQGLMPRVALHFESAMSDPRATSEDVYAALKSYLMMYDDRRMDDAWFVGAVGELWRARFGGRIADRATRHLAALVLSKDLQVARFHPRSDEGIALARAKVATLSLVDRAQAQLRLTASQAEPLRLSEVLGPAGVGIFERRSQKALTDPLEPIFTAEGYRRDVKPRLGEVARRMIDEEAWVLADKASGVGRQDSSRVALELQRRYFDDYEKYWRALLDDLQLRKLDGLREAQVASQALAQPDSPLRRLVTAVAEQTRLSGSASAGDKARQVAEEVGASKLKDAVTGKVAGLFGSQGAEAAAPAPPADPTRQLEQQLEDRFKDFRDLAGDGKTGRIESATALLAEVASELSVMKQKIGSGIDIKELPPKLGMARERAGEFPQPISSVITGLVQVGERVGKTEEGKSFAREAGAASAFCRRAMPGKYPFNRLSNNDVGVQDFEAVFKAGGELDAFFVKDIAPYVDRSGPQWRLKAGAEASSQIPPTMLRQFQNADAIRKAFLPTGASARVTADLTVVSAPGEVVIDYGGARHVLVSGASVRLVWPAAPGARLTFAGASVVSAEGPWALFRLIDKGTLDPVSSGDRLRLGYTAPDGSKATIELRTGSAAFNPFRLREINDFSCP